MDFSEFGCVRLLETVSGWIWAGSRLDFGAQGRADSAHEGVNSAQEGVRSAQEGVRSAQEG